MRRWIEILLYLFQINVFQSVEFQDEWMGFDAFFW